MLVTHLCSEFSCSNRINGCFRKKEVRVLGEYVSSHSKKKKKIAKIVKILVLIQYVFSIHVE